MNARILSFRGSRRGRTMNQLLLEVDGVDSKAKAIKLVGKRVVWSSPAGKKISGKITNIHGGKGVVRVRFPKGLPGTAIAQNVKLSD